jgi:hypothetical protein
MEQFSKVRINRTGETGTVLSSYSHGGRRHLVLSLDRTEARRDLPESAVTKIGDAKPITKPQADPFASF